MQTRLLAAEVLAALSDSVILIFGGTYMSCQKGANNMLQRRTYSMHKGRPLVKLMLVVTITECIVHAWIHILLIVKITTRELQNVSLTVIQYQSAVTEG